MVSRVAQNQLGLSPRGKDFSKGCLSVLGIFLVVYVIQIFYVSHRIHTPLQQHDLGSGYELEIKDSYTVLNYVPLIGFLNLNIIGEYSLVVKKDGMAVFSTDIFGEDAHTPLTHLKIYNHQGVALLTYSVNPNYPQVVHLNLPAPTDAPPWPAPTTPSE